jgi:hypothetical protein
MLSQDQIETYRRDGFIVVEGVLSAAEVAALREVTDRFVERARSVTEHDNAFDLEPSHTREEPRIRRMHCMICAETSISSSPGWSRFRCPCRCPLQNMPARSTSLSGSSRTAISPRLKLRKR